ncbi:hypothetical protein [Solirhodobacter olei]|uniref:hypothetical protein n=1 Tax=Solirhodobacter olei TaxID=2493082 RepID=UPI000FDC9CBE|nr:hypothetical protein [Solirhodobacter olei]
MQFIKSIFSELLGLFVDDGNLALQVLGLIVIVALAVRLGGLMPLAGAGLLLLGCIVILALSLRRMLRR